MGSARIGIVFDVNDAALKAALTRSSKMFVDSFGNLGTKVEGSMNAAMNGVSASVKRASTAVAGSFKETENAAKRAADAIAAGEKRLADMRIASANKTTAQLINEHKQLQDRKAAIEVQITREHDEEVKKRLNAEKRAIGDELKLRKQVAMDRPEVQTGGAGAKAGMMGTGRQMLGDMAGNLPGGGLLAGGMAAAGPAALAMGLQQVISIGAEFEDSLADMGAIIGAEGAELKQLGDIGREVGMKFGIDGKGGVEAMKFVIGAFGPEVAKNQTALKGMTNEVLQFAKAGGLDAADAADSLIISVSQFGYASASSEVKAQQMARAANLMAAAAKEGSMEIPALSAAMKVSGATSNEMGVSMEKTAAMMELLKKHGSIEGAEAGTAYRNVLLKMSSGSKEANEALAKMGLTFNDINPKKVGLTEALTTLKGGFDKIQDPVQKSAALQKLFGMENANASLAMMKSAGELDAFTEKITGTSSAQEMAEQKMATFNEQMNKMMVQVKDVAITLFDLLKPALDLVMGALGFLFDILKAIGPTLVDMMTWIQQLAIAFVKWLAASEPVQKAMAWLKVAVADVVAWVTKAWAAIQEWAQGMSQRLQPTIQWLQGALQSILGWLGQLAQFIWARVVTAFNQFMAAVNWVGGAINTVIGAVSSVINWFSNLGSSVMKLGGFWGGLLAPIKAVIGVLGDVINKAREAINWIKRAVGAGDDAPAPGSGSSGGGPTAADIAGGVAGGGGAGAGNTAPPGGQGGAGGGTGGGGTAPKPPKPPKETAEQKNQRLFNAAKEAAEEAKAELYSKAEVDRTLGKINDEEQKQQQLAAEKKYLETLLEAAKQYGQKTGEIQRNIELNAARIRNAGFEVQREILQDAKNDEMAEIERKLNEVEMSDKEAKKAQMEAEIAYLESLKKLMIEHEQDTDEIQTKLTTLRRNHKRAEFEAEEDRLGQEHADRMQILDDQKNDGLLSESEYLTKRAELHRRHEKELLDTTRRLGVQGKYTEKGAEKAGGLADKDEKAAAKARTKEASDREKEFEQTNIAYKSLMTGLGNIVDQGMGWMEERWQTGFKNKKTVLFQALQQFSGVLKDFIGGTAKELVKWAATIIGQNAAVAASWISTAAAAAWSWVASLGPLGWIAGAGIAVGIATQWQGIKKLFMKDGGVLNRATPLGMVGDRMAIAGEAGPEAVIPLAQLPAMVGDINARSSSQAAMASEIRALRQEMNSRPIKTYVVASEMEARLLELKDDRYARSL